MVANKNYKEKIRQIPGLIKMKLMDKYGITNDAPHEAKQNECAKECEHMAYLQPWICLVPPSVINIEL